MVSIKLAINNKSVNGPIDYKGKESAWKTAPPKRVNSWKIRCFIFQCKDIPSADTDGSSDPYISIWT